ncbi:hypothetical protein HID58_014177, partial [Brassica napus]
VLEHIYRHTNIPLYRIRVYYVKLYIESLIIQGGHRALPIIHKLTVQTYHEAMANMTTKLYGMGFLLIFLNEYNGCFVANVRVMVLAATNRPSELDEAILRRLPQAFDIGMPDRKEKYEILKDIFELCEKATYFPIREILEKEGKGRPCPVPRPLSQLDLEKVLDWIWRKFLLCRRRRKLQQASTVG